MGQAKVLVTGQAKVLVTGQAKVSGKVGLSVKVKKLDLRKIELGSPSFPFMTKMPLSLKMDGAFQETFDARM